MEVEVEIHVGSREIQSRRARLFNVRLANEMMLLPGVSFRPAHVRGELLLCVGSIHTHTYSKEARGPTNLNVSISRTKRTEGGGWKERVAYLHQSPLPPSTF